MNLYAAISLVTLIAVILLGFFRKVNVGLLAILAAALLGSALGLSDSTIINGFSASQFVYQSSGRVVSLLRRHQQRSPGDRVQKVPAPGRRAVLCGAHYDLRHRLCRSCHRPGLCACPGHCVRFVPASGQVHRL